MNAVTLGGVILKVAWPVAVMMNAGIWVLWSATVGWWQARRPWTSLHPRTREQLRPWEHDGLWYLRRVGVRRWKGWLPEAGPLFAGLSKRRRPSSAEGGWERLAAECLRAERTHRAIAWATPCFVVWNPLGLFLANVVFAVVANLPCWVVARSTRGRVEAALRRRRVQR
jgi:glycosyl-4,4'-diaponeurosporenoate acyltransferase